MTKTALIQYALLMRLNRPVGIYLLLWPTLMALWFAAEGPPPLLTLIIFSLGVLVMRSAGCVINDYADRKIDGHVKRTQSRPMANGLVTPKEALILFASLIAVAFMLVLLTNKTTVLMSIAAVALAASYPFMKRYTYLPQVALGAAFSWAIPMAYTSVGAELSPITWLLFTANLLWTVAYDTLYAMVDRDDDLKIGVKSTAILFGDADKLIIGSLQILTLLSWAFVGAQSQLGVLWWLGLFVSSGLFIHQQWQIRARQREACFQAFLNNHWIGLVMLVAAILSV